VGTHFLVHLVDKPLLSLVVFLSFAQVIDSLLLKPQLALLDRLELLALEGSAESTCLLQGMCHLVGLTPLLIYLSLGNVGCRHGIRVLQLLNGQFYLEQQS